MSPFFKKKEKKSDADNILEMERANPPAEEEKTNCEREECRP